MGFFCTYTSCNVSWFPAYSPEHSGVLPTTYSLSYGSPSTTSMCSYMTKLRPFQLLQIMKQSSPLHSTVVLLCLRPHMQCQLHRHRLEKSSSHPLFEGGCVHKAGQGLYSKCMQAADVYAVLLLPTSGGDCTCSVCPLPFHTPACTTCSHPQIQTVMHVTIDGPPFLHIT